MSTLAAFIRLLRPLNLLIILLGVIVGAVLAYGTPTTPSWPTVILAGAAAMLIAGGGNVINDVFDLEADIVNRPDRPLPSRWISPGAARTFWITLTLAGLAAAAAVSWVHLAVGALAAALLYLYSARLQRMPLVGNLTVAFLVALVLIFGGLVAGAPGRAAAASVFALLTTLAREVIKDVADVEGDRAAGQRTVPIVFGVAVARGLFLGAVLLTILLTPIPFLAMEYGPLFLLLVLVADLVLLRSIWPAAGAPEEAASASSWLKGGMIVGLAAFFFA